MLATWTDLDRAISMFRHEMDRLAQDDVSGSFDGRDLATSAWPRIAVYDRGERYEVVAEVPGLSENDLTLNITGDVLTISGERKAEVPEGYFVHRRERPEVKFSRSVSFGVKIDSEKTAASVKDGLLTIDVAKSPESKPRKIQVRKA